MASRPVAFAATGNPLSADSSTGGGAIGAPGEITPGGVETTAELMGFAFSGFTAVDLYDGTDNTGTLVAHAAAPGTYSWNEPLLFSHGVHVECAGAGKGSIWVG